MLRSWIFTLGFFVMLHAVFSASQSLRFQRMAQMEDVTLPSDILFEGLVGFVICVVGSLIGMPSLKKIKTTAKLSEQSFDSLNSRPEFLSFQHRGKYMGAFLTKSS
eukprot:TRINITY_DN894_c0_g1_i1.p1 TRINITY_DN894_c0_g1~~TRINITY_DN894_c0_g1_i1.p1  ORF type:complete len:106 (-),score=21.58 TRINITY_DN894_c0_g1_i1:65-382(-)